MGFLAPAPPRAMVSTVRTDVGQATLEGTIYRKARLWILEDYSVVLCVPATADGQGVSRIHRTAVYATWDAKAKLTTVETAEGETITLDSRGCACGMGAIANAGPVEGPYKIVRVRNPEWMVEL